MRVFSKIFFVGCSFASKVQQSRTITFIKNHWKLETDKKPFFDVVPPHPAFDRDVYFEESGNIDPFSSEFAYLNIMDKKVGKLGEIGLYNSAKGRISISNINLSAEVRGMRLGKGISIYMIVGQIARDFGCVFYSTDNNRINRRTGQASNDSRRVWEKLAAMGLAKREGDAYVYTG